MPHELRLVLAISLDGRLAPPKGGAAHLGGEGDRKVLDRALAWADGCLIGAGTLRAHRCTCLIHDPELLQQRLTAGRSPQPSALVVTSRMQPQFPLDWPFFHQPLERQLLRPADPSLPDGLIPGFDHVHVMADSWHQTLDGLASKGLHRLLLLGGASLTSSLLQADAVDELQLTLAPRVLGGRHGWVPFTEESLPSGLAVADAWSLQECMPLESNELMVLYRRRRSSSV